MASFTALNIEPDDHSDVEVDNTKELRIEDALKLYQAALKLHAQGVAFYPQAAEAYKTLFQSEIFTYPEAITEFTRLEEHPEVEYVDSSAPLNLDIGPVALDGTSSTLPQILYLAYKNHGQFILDCIKCRLRNAKDSTNALEDLATIAIQAKLSLEDFGRALASDESDTELWRRAGRVAAMLGSRRIYRFCLEAAVEVDDDPTVAEVEPQSLEEGFAGEQLKQELELLSDELSLFHPIMGPFKKKYMPEFLRKHMDPYPFLPNPIRHLEHNEGNSMEIPQGRTIISVPDRSWTSVGHELGQAALSPQGLPSSGAILALPPGEEQNDSMDDVTAVQDQIQDQLMKDTIMTISPAADSSGNATPCTLNSEERIVEVVTTTTVPLADGHSVSASSSLPTRKRSQSAAGLREVTEEENNTHKRSRRIRNRESTAETPVDPATQYAEQLLAFSKADDDVFRFVHNLLSKLGVEDLGIRQQLEIALSASESSGRKEALANTAVRDLRDIMRSWDDSKASLFQNTSAADILGSSAGGANAGLAAFLEHSKSGPQKISNKPIHTKSSGLDLFAQKIESEWLPLQDTVFEWLCIILSTYQQRLWPEDLKVAVVRVISFLDADVYSRISSDLNFQLVSEENPKEVSKFEKLTQTIFELHLDVYSRITNPNSVVQYEIRVMTKDRLDRWADFAASVIHSRERQPDDELALRYLWASVFYATIPDDVSREHKVLLWADLQRILGSVDRPAIELPNNAVMPEISISAAEREVSRLTTMEFFQNLFQADKTDPLSIIETLEPVLDPESTAQSARNEDALRDEGGPSDSADNTPAALRDMWKFLQSGSTSLRLFLWQRLREAYVSIGYNTKVFSCHLKCIEIIVADMRSADYVDSSDEPRRHKLLVWFKALDDLLVKALTIALNDAATCFEIIDERHLKSTCAALAQLSRVLHPAAVFDDEVRVGMTTLPQTPTYALHGSFNAFLNKLREMQVRTWALQYTMIKEAMAQNRELFSTPDNDLADYLALVHYALGLRKCCKVSNKIFLKMMKVEMSRLKHVDKWEDYLGQVLFDLYGIRLGVGACMLDDHGCPTENLDRRTVLSIAQQVISIANNMPMKDLMKHELRPTIEKMQTAVGQAKSTPAMTHNLRNITEYLKTSIRPHDMYQALRGQAQIDSVTVQTQDSPLANKGWYFLLGMMALTKFRSQKRLGPGTQTDDMQIGAHFMKLQLQYTIDHWEAWYRLAQCYDLELEEEVLWSADKINNHRQDLVRLQRHSIHCYIMALSTAMRCADSTFGAAEKLSEMYHDFGMRLYASSREPFSMEAFYVDDEKHMSGPAGMYKAMQHEEMSRYKVWKYASRLFRRSLVDRPNYWLNHFMLGKCEWKMITRSQEEWEHKGPPSNLPTIDMILKHFVRAIETCPKPRDSRQEPVLEPHYKLVSLVHKLVSRGEMEPQAAAKLLQEQPYGPRKGDPFVISDEEDWEIFILACFRQLRNADKPHWHHRMIARVANIIYDDSKPDYVQACAARIEFRESIFTKTMSMNVWKPDAERPGRHFVYMQRYAMFMAKLLFLINDKANMEQLAKRVRKRAVDFYKFNDVWNECCTTYLRLIRKAASIPANVDEVFKGISQAEFDAYSERIELSISDGSLSYPALDALRETIELKKLNGSISKVAPIDDMINDIWAVLYIQVVKDTPPIDAASLQIPQADGETAAKSSGPMSLNHLMNTDATSTELPTSVEPPKPRKLGISRRAVIQKAEQAIARAGETTKPIIASRPRNSISTPVVPANSSPQIGGSSTPRIEIPLTAVQHSAPRDDSSAPGSVHDSADDESDLSDVPDMDDMDASMIFPNLMRRVGSTSGRNTPVQDS
ncbi:Histone transcription regulator 3 [Clarireedia jacksonii]